MIFFLNLFIRRFSIWTILFCSQIATEVGNYDGIGQDLVAVCTNDLLCRCAKPIGFLDYCVTGKLRNTEAVKVVESMVNVCERIECALVGNVFLRVSCSVDVASDLLGNALPCFKEYMEQLFLNTEASAF